MATSKPARNWVFTCNNYTDDDIRDFESVTCRYIIFGKEVAPTSGTPHLQGYIQMGKPCRLSAMKKINAKAAFFQARAGASKNQIYCSKENIYHERGEPAGQGQRSDLTALNKAIKEGATFREIHERFPEKMARYEAYIHRSFSYFAPKPAAPEITLYDWQKELLEILKQEPHPRQIHFYVDYQGNAGKSTFAKYIFSLYENAQLMEPGKVADMAHIINRDTRILLFDCPRSTTEQLQYRFLESLKNGWIQSSKYNSTVKYLNPMHVIVFMNEMPNTTKLSSDRFVIKEI